MPLGRVMILGAMTAATMTMSPAASAQSGVWVWQEAKGDFAAASAKDGVVIFGPRAIVAAPTPPTAPLRDHDTPAAADAAPRFSRLSAKAKAAIGMAAERHADAGLDHALLRAVITAESSGDPNAVSAKGAKGLMQLTEAAASDYGVSDPFDEAQNIRGGAAYLARLLRDHDGDVDLALAAWNAGPARVARYGGVPPFPETRRFIRRVRALTEAARRARLFSHQSGDTDHVSQTVFPG